MLSQHRKIRKRGKEMSLKRICIAISRRKKETFQLLAIFFFVGMIVSLIIGLKSAEAKMEIRLRDEAKIAVSIVADTPVMGEQFVNLTQAQITAIGESEYVRSYDYNLRWSLESETVQKYIPEGQPSYDNRNTFGIVGSEYAPILDIEEQIFTLVEGRTFTEAEIYEGNSVTLISEEVAQLNGIKIGDIITFQNNIGEFSRKNNGAKYVEVDGEIQNYAQQILNFEVIGIVKYQEETTGEQFVEDERQEDIIARRKYNTMYLPNKVVQEVIEFHQQKNHEQYPEMFPINETGLSEYDPIYFLKSEQDLEAFSESIKSLIPENYRLYSTLDSATNYAQTIGMIREKTMPLFYSSITILFLITMLGCYQYLKNRIHEYGIYISLAEKKLHIFLQTLAEICLIASVICIPAVIVGQTLVPKIGEPLFMYQLEESLQQNQKNEIQRNNPNLEYPIEGMSKEMIKQKYHEETYSIAVVEILSVIITISIPAATIVILYIIKKSKKYLL